MNTKTVKGVADALLVFVDVVDSSKYSSTLTYEDYARRLLYFQTAFKKLGRKYFPEVEDKALDFNVVDARGDEGIIFVTTREGDRDKLIFQAIEFIYHLKGILKFGTDGEEGEPQNKSPSKLGVGAGIHFGQVALTIENKEGHSLISGVEGFSINYAKRVESSSRDGRFSRIMLSLDASKYLQVKPIILSEIRAPMKGIADNVELYEVQSGLFDHLLLDSNDVYDQVLITKICELTTRPEMIDEPWVKAFIVSVLESLILMTDINHIKDDYIFFFLNSNSGAFGIAFRFSSFFLPSSINKSSLSFSSS